MQQAFALKTTQTEKSTGKIRPINGYPKDLVILIQLPNSLPMAL